VTYFIRVILTENIYPGKNPPTQKESTMSDITICTAFCGVRKLFSGPLGEVALHVKRALEGGAADSIQVFDDSSGRIVDLDLRGSDEEVVARLSQPAPVYRGRYRAPTALSDALPAGEGQAGEPRGRGRPRLGVVAREVTLLPRQWEWLAAQAGGASATLRRLIDSERKKPDTRQQRRRAQEAAYHFMLAMAGDLPGYEDATRALFAGDLGALERHIAEWPEDVRMHVLLLVRADGGAEG
jgi:hypothetical protein